MDALTSIDKGENLAEEIEFHLKENLRILIRDLDMVSSLRPTTIMENST